MNIDKHNYCFTCVFFIPAPCFLMCMMFYVFLTWIPVSRYAFAIHFMVHCGSAFEPGASGLHHYCTSFCVRSWCNWRANCVDSKKKCRHERSEKQHAKIECVSTTRTYHDTYKHVTWIAEVPSSQALPGYLITAHHLCAFLLYLAR